jgi:adenine-specific DNA glycosylase
VRTYCQAREQGVENQLPLNGVRSSASRRELHLLLIEKDDKILAWQRPFDSQRLAGFWELPERAQLLGAAIHTEVGGFRHTIVNTTYLVQVLRASIRSCPRGFRWLAKSSFGALPVSTTTKKALACLAKE